MHDSDCESSDDDKGELRCAEGHEVTAVLERGEPEPQPEAHGDQLAVVGLKYEDIEDERQDLHDLLDDGGEVDRHILRGDVGRLSEKATDICGKETDHHAHDEGTDKPACVPLGEDERDQERDSDADKDVFGINHTSRPPFRDLFRP